MQQRPGLKDGWGRQWAFSLDESCGAAYRPDPLQTYVDKDDKGNYFCPRDLVSESLDGSSRA